MNPIYVDLDQTLIHPTKDRIHPRPGAAEFLQQLAGHGEVYILSHALRSHVDTALPALGFGADYISGILTREDLQPVIDQLDHLRTDIQPIFPPGVIFDDQPIGSPYHLIKSTALGISDDLWIQVPAYNRVNPNDTALKAAYKKFKHRFVGANG